jgi:hypothetical protein
MSSPAATRSVQPDLAARRAERHGRRLGEAEEREVGTGLLLALEREAEALNHSDELVGRHEARSHLGDVERAALLEDTRGLVDAADPVGAHKREADTTASTISAAAGSRFLVFFGTSARSPPGRPGSGTRVRKSHSTTQPSVPFPSVAPPRRPRRQSRPPGRTRARPCPAARARASPASPHPRSAITVPSVAGRGAR